MNLQPINPHKVEQAEALLLQLPQVPCPITHLFVKGLYWRELFIPAGTVAIGHLHKTEHLNVLLSGKVRVFGDGGEVELEAPKVFATPPGVRKVVLALEDSRWVNIHANPDDSQDMDVIESRLIEKSETWRQHHAAIPQRN